MAKNHTEAQETFYERVYAFVEAVPPGRVVTYGQVALELGSPGAARAVGYALYFQSPERGVPWWRVINVRGAISFKNRGAAADRQRELLEQEGVRFDAKDCVDLHVFRWWPEE
jgi:methylated-DNA-protein-cysteine methyltransferase related protein